MDDTPQFLAGPTILAGLVGRGIAASASPAIHQREAREHGLSLEYRLVDFAALELADDALEAKLEELVAGGFAGVNITHPFKQQVIPLLDEVDETALALGAVNCVAFRDGRMIGSNSDWIGFTFLMQHDLAGAKLDCVTLIGAGGAGSAASYALLRLGVGELRILETDADRAQALADRLRATGLGSTISCHADPAAALDGADGVVQASPVGMAAHPGMPIDPELLSASQWFAELVYFPRETELLKAARAKGLRATGGTAMAIGQAVAPFTAFTGVEPDFERMLAAILAADRGNADSADRAA